MRVVRRLAVPLICLALAGLPGLACGGEEEPAGGGGGGGGVTIDMKDIKYVPANATAKVGQTVTWTNSDAVAHTVTKESGPGPDFDSGAIAAGKTYKQTFDEPGEIAYVCTIHPAQTGTLRVTE
jgi:plastocyanin